MILFLFSVALSLSSSYSAIIPEHRCALFETKLTSEFLSALSADPAVSVESAGTEYGPQRVRSDAVIQLYAKTLQNMITHQQASPAPTGYAPDGELQAFIQNLVPLDATESPGLVIKLRARIAMGNEIVFLFNGQVSSEFPFGSFYFLPHAMQTVLHGVHAYETPDQIILHDLTLQYPAFRRQGVRTDLLLMYDKKTRRVNLVLETMDFYPAQNPSDPSQWVVSDRKNFFLRLVPVTSIDN